MNIKHLESFGYTHISLTSEDGLKTYYNAYFNGDPIELRVVEEDGDWKVYERENDTEYWRYMGYI